MTSHEQSDLFELDQKNHPEEFTHARFSNHGYELSSHGDKRFSALFARLKDGRTIEEAYQLDIKGYRAISNDWRAGKGRPAMNGLSHNELWLDYLQLWRDWASENPEKMEDLRQKANGRVLTDKFSSSPISQARALAQILNETNDGHASRLKIRTPNL